MIRPTRLLALMLVLVSTFVTVGSVHAQPQPYQYFSGEGGEIKGYVLGVDKEPFDWAAVYARNTQHTFQAFSGMSGFYEMRIPPGTYNMTVDVPSYQALLTNTTAPNSSTIFHLNSMNVTVSDGSSSVVNFYLQQSQMRVPEFQPPLVLMLVIGSIAVVLQLKRLKK